MAARTVTIHVCDGCGNETEQAADDRTIPTGWRSWYTDLAIPEGEPADRKPKDEGMLCAVCTEATRAFIATLTDVVAPEPLTMEGDSIHDAIARMRPDRVADFTPGEGS